MKEVGRRPGPHGRNALHALAEKNVAKRAEDDHHQNQEISFEPQACGRLHAF
jgi:hypothetical protein